MSDPRNEHSPNEHQDPAQQTGAAAEAAQDTTDEHPADGNENLEAEGDTVGADQERQPLRGARNGVDGGFHRRRRRRRSDEYRPEDDERALAALTFTSDVVSHMDIDCRVRLRRPKEDDARNEIRLEIVGRDAGRIIGKKGQVLSALQFLVHRVVNRPGAERRPIVVDAEGYRSRRDNSLASMARRLGRQAVDEGKIITFEPMNPRERRVIHLALAKFQGVITKSEGEGDSRRVQIIPVRRQD
jgi:spoIIIJ-associated protein